jgi:Ni,Fe-hydrogenase III small subunit
MGIGDWARKRSPWAYHLCIGGGCNGCDIELLAVLAPKYDVERFGIRLVDSPKHADVILLTGCGTRKSLDKALEVYNQVPEPKKTVAIGACAITHGIFRDSGNMKEPIDKYIKVDMYVPGCPPRPEAIIDAIYKVIK